jgi:pimeloyl-ACP methyl ester carboxylesterase
MNNPVVRSPVQIFAKYYNLITFHLCDLFILGFSKFNPRENTKMKKIIICFPILIIFYGCGSSNNIQYPEPSSIARDGSFYSKEGIFEFGEKEYKADYGTVTVPENRKKPGSKLIHLPVIRIHSWKESDKEPVFGMVGGPGQSNMNFHPFDTLLYDHDFVLVGYRGVDGSTVLNCPEVSEAIENAEDNILSEKSLKQYAEAWKIALNHLKASGIDLNGYTIQETIEDFETVRKAFNYNKINLISESYGTRVAYLYGVMHPESIHRSVMIGVNPPGGFIIDPDTVDKQIEYYSDLWAKDSVMSEKCPDLAASIKKVLKNMPEKWLFFSIDPGKVRIMTFAMLYQRQTAALVFDAFVAAENGDNSGLALMSLAMDYAMPNVVWGDYITKAVTADKRYWEKKPEGYANRNTILGSPLNEYSWKVLQYEDFDLEMISDSLQVPLNSNVETLLLSGSIDFANPPQYATNLLHYLKNGKQVIMSEAGHVGDLRYLQLDATKGLIADFINEGVVDTSEIKYVPMDFNVSWGFPSIAKTALYTVTAVVLLLTAGVLWWIL